MLKITTLIENGTGEHRGLKAEHGISFCVEKDGRKILFDTGQSGAFIQNAALLGISLEDTEYVVLSHGHYDHAGGFRSLSGVVSSFRLMVGEGFFEEKYASRGPCRDYLGPDFNEAWLREKGISYSFFGEDVREILPGAYLLSRFPRIHGDERIHPRFVLRRGGSFLPDLFEDEILLALDTSGGIVVLLGCAHPGMRNMLDGVKNRLGRPILAVLGGTHLVESKGVSLERSLRYFEEESVRIIGVSHCTGSEAVSRLRASSGNFFHNVTGSSLFLE